MSQWDEGYLPEAAFRLMRWAARQAAIAERDVPAPAGSHWEPVFSRWRSRYPEFDWVLVPDDNDRKAS